MRLNKVSVQLLAILDPLCSQNLESVGLIRIVLRQESQLRQVRIGVVLIREILATEYDLVRMPVLLFWVAEERFSAVQGLLLFLCLAAIELFFLEP